MRSNWPLLRAVVATHQPSLAPACSFLTGVSRCPGTSTGPSHPISNQQQCGSSRRNRTRQTPSRTPQENADSRCSIKGCLRTKVGAHSEHAALLCTCVVSPHLPAPEQVKDTLRMRPPLAVEAADGAAAHLNATRRPPACLPAGKGGKNRRRGKNDSDDKRELIFKEDGACQPACREVA